MSAIQIRGLGPLHGELEIQGSKNAVLPVMAAAVLSALWLGAPFTVWDLAGFICVFVMLLLLSMKGNGKKSVPEYHPVRNRSTDNMDET